MLKLPSRLLLAAAAMTALASPAIVSADTIKIRVTVENLAPVNGNFLTPVWIGFHDGGFDLFDVGSAASPALEALAEDGNASLLAADLMAAGGSLESLLFGPGGPIAPGDVASAVFEIDLDDPNSLYFSYAAMILPSNDAFIGNADAISLVDANGNFIGADIFLDGNNVYDAGTEVNDELPENTAFFGQSMPNTGVTEDGVVGLHPGFLPAGSGGILDDPRYANADFTRANYPIAQITVSAVPVPAAVWLFGSAVAGLFVRRRKA